MVVGQPSGLDQADEYLSLLGFRVQFNVSINVRLVRTRELCCLSESSID